jgi:hypothetical protein
MFSMATIEPTLSIIYFANGNSFTSSGSVYDCLNGPNYWNNNLAAAAAAAAATRFY